MDRDTGGKMISGEFAPPFLLRFGAAMIDYILLLALPVGGLLSDRFFGNLGIVTDRTLWFWACILTVVNLVVLPVLYHQSIGKMLTGTRIVNRDGTAAGAGQVLARQTIGYLLTLGTLGIGFFTSIFGRRARTLHDLVAGTLVIRATRREVQQKR